MPWFIVEAEVTEVKRVNYVVKAGDSETATNAVEEGNANYLVLERNSEVIDHIETHVHDVIELD